VSRAIKAFQYVIRYTGKLKTVEEFGNVIIRAEDNGQFLRLKMWPVWNWDLFHTTAM